MAYSTSTANDDDHDELGDFVVELPLIDSIKKRNNPIIKKSSSPSSGSLSSLLATFQRQGVIRIVVILAAVMILLLAIAAMNTGPSSSSSESESESEFKSDMDTVKKNSISLDQQPSTPTTATKAPETIDVDQPVPDPKPMVSDLPSPTSPPTPAPTPIPAPPPPPPPAEERPRSESPVTNTAESTTTRSANLPNSSSSTSTSSSSADTGSKTQHQQSGSGSGGLDLYLPKGRKRPDEEWSDTYLRRTTGPSTNAVALEQMWGSWTLLDVQRSQRPNLDDLYNRYPNADIPRTAFPASAWQIDTMYLQDFLTQGLALVDRAMEAILAEYGHSKFDQPNRSFPDRSEMFSFQRLTATGSCKGKTIYKTGGGTSGCINEAFIHDVQRSLLHAIMTESSWTYVMGGHSSSAGHGNHFKQSYTLQIQRILEPVMARLGVYHKAHNFGMGGLGTIQNSMGARSIYGSDIDILEWNSGMTEHDDQSIDTFARQGLLSGDRVPPLIADTGGMGYAASAAVGGALLTFWGAGYKGLATPSTLKELKSLPYAEQYILCEKEIKDLCKNNGYNSTCWIDRADVRPKTVPGKYVGGRASWHPGNRLHQLQSRVIAFNILRFLKAGLIQWSQADNYALPDDAWHVTARYNEVRSKILALKKTSCYNFQGMPKALCEVPIQARTEFTPRHNAMATSIRSIMKPGGRIPQPPPNLYDPPDVTIPQLEVPRGAVDYLAIVENGIDFVPNRARRLYVETQKRIADGSYFKPMPPLVAPDKIQPGLGWSVNTVGASDNCDGSYNSFCHREASFDCLLSGHNDYRGGLRFDSYSGWGVFNLEDMKHGVIFIKVEDYIGPNANPATEGWKCENNACSKSGGGSGSHHYQRKAELVGQNSSDTPRRRLANKAPPPSCEDYTFQFAINGKITSWSFDKWKTMRKTLQRVVMVVVLLDDPNFTGGQTMDVELAMRLTGNCGRGTTFQLSHIYWA